MIHSSRRLTSRLAGAAAAVVAAALPVQGGTAVKTGQTDTHATQVPTGISAALAGQHMSLVPTGSARADSRFERDAFHRWSPS